MMNEMISMDPQEAWLVELADATDPAFVLELLEDLRNDGAGYADAMASAIDQRNREALRLAAHSLKSMMQSLGFADAGEACRLIEEGALRPLFVSRFVDERSLIERELRRAQQVGRDWAHRHGLDLAR